HASQTGAAGGSGGRGGACFASARNRSPRPASTSDRGIISSLITLLQVGRQERFVRLEGLLLFPRPRRAVGSGGDRRGLGDSARPLRRLVDVVGNVTRPARRLALLALPVLRVPPALEGL